MKNWLSEKPARNATNRQKISSSIWNLVFLWAKKKVWKFVKPHFLFLILQKVHESSFLTSVRSYLKSYLPSISFVSSWHKGEEKFMLYLSFSPIDWEVMERNRFKTFKQKAFCMHSKICSKCVWNTVDLYQAQPLHVLSHFAHNILVHELRWNTFSFDVGWIMSKRQLTT